MDINKFIEAYELKEKERLEVLERQIKKGCDKCSQWDEYWGCNKCEQISMHKGKG